MKLVITGYDNVSWEYALPIVAAELLRQVGSGELDRIILIENEPAIRRGQPMKFEFNREASDDY